MFHCAARSLLVRVFISALTLTVAGEFVHPGLARADDAACIGALDKSVARISKTRGKDVSSCLKSADHSGTATLTSCATADAKGKIAKTTAQALARDVGGAKDTCGGVPAAFAYIGAAGASSLAAAEPIALARAALGADLDAAVVTGGDTGAAKCHGRVVNSAVKLFDKQAKTYFQCVKKALKDGATSEGELVAACFDPGATALADPKGSIARAATRVLDSARKSCIDPGEATAALFPGSCAGETGDPDFGACIVRLVDCSVCRLLDGVHTLGVDCDLLDDGSANQSCADTFFTYLGGTGNGTLYYSAVRDVAVDASGNVYAAGGISLGGYATAGAAQETFQGGDSDAFVASFTADGTLRFFTYLGGPNHDRAYAIDVDDTGIYVAGRAGDLFPTTVGAFQTAFAGGGGGEYGTQDGFVAKLSLDGSQWLWVTYVGGNGPEILRDIDVDSSGNVWCAMIGLTGAITLLDGGPGAFQPAYGGGDSDAALLKLAADGASLLYRTYIGGSGNEVGAATVRTTSDDGVYYVVSTESDNDLATPGAYRTARVALADVILLRFDSAGQRLWGTYYGGSGNEGGETHNLGIGADDTPVVAMFTTSSNLPGMSNGATGGEGFAVRFSADGTSVLGARYVGGSGTDEIEGIDVQGNRIVVSGGTTSADFPVTGDAAYPGSGGTPDGFVTVLPLALDSELYSTRVPGAHYDWVNSVAFGPSGEIVFGGNSQSFNLPVGTGAFETAPNPAIPTVSPTEIDPGWDAGFLGRIAAP